MEHKRVVHYLIWSNEHGAWWAPNAMGYTNKVGNAGRFDRKTAADIVSQANLGLPANQPHEVAMLEPVDISTPHDLPVP
jgi:hypothetical protein